ncbi:MAG: motility protein A [Bacteriovoracia bacterium]
MIYGQISNVLGFILLVVLLTILKLRGVQFSQFIDITSLIVVLGGTLIAGLFSYKFSTINALKLHVQEILKKRIDIKTDIDDLIGVLRTLQKGDLLEAEKVVNNVKSSFLRFGLNLYLDNSSSEELVKLMNWKIKQTEQAGHNLANVLYTMSNYAPAFGLLGTLMGLIGMLSDLGTRDLGLIGTKMALALITTFYGILFSNLVFRPVAIKIEQRTLEKVRQMTILYEGLLLARRGSSPYMIQEHLKDTISKVLHE